MCQVSLWRAAGVRHAWSRSSQLVHPPCASWRAELEPIAFESQSRSLDVVIRKCDAPWRNRPVPSQPEPEVVFQGPNRVCNSTCKRPIKVDYSLNPRIFSLFEFATATLDGKTLHTLVTDSIGRHRATNLRLTSTASASSNLKRRPTIALLCLLHSKQPQSYRGRGFGVRA